jgi:3-oxosteroid 1-dehydrogenase
VDETFDFVVAGSGGGSMCAGLFMRSLGKSVLILEKTEVIGGSTARSGGVMWIPNNQFMKQAGIPDSEEQALTYLDAVIGDAPDAPGASRPRRLAYVREGTKMIDFLVGQGIKLRRVGYYPDYYDDRPGGCVPGRTVVAELFNVNELGPWKDRLRPGFMVLQGALDEMFELPGLKRSWKSKRVMAGIMLRTTLAKLTGRRWVTAGAALQGRMLQAALKAGIDLRTEAPVKELIVEGGRVTGVVATIGGVERRIGARNGVLINAGGFAHNQAMRDKYIPGTSAQWTNSPEGDTGEMILEAHRVGGALAQMADRVGNQMAIPPGHKGLNPMIQGDLAKPHAILVDQSGERYQTEGGSYSEFCAGMLKRNQTTPAVPSWMIVDSQHLRNYFFLGTLPGSKKPQAWYDQGFLRQAPTIRALAEACKIPPERLEATIERFNGFARRGRDEDFGRGRNAYDKWLGDKWADDKSAASLGVIEEAPFYAVPVVPGDVGTFGGVVTDEYARVLTEDGSVIQGLYATGNSTASVMGGTYPGAGCSLGPSFTWGYVAAKHAANAGNLAA